LRLVASLAEDRTVTTGLEWNRGLLAASGTDNRCSLRCPCAITAATAVSPAASALLFVFLCLAAGFAPLWRGIAALAEKCLIVGRKCKFLSAVAACKLQVPSHNSSLSCSFRLESSCAGTLFYLDTQRRRSSESLSSG
jgi:hypothetical protein